jgi:hypothetical protein
MTTLNVAPLNFEDIKANLKEWMRSHSDFTDYDFEASGLSYLLDVLAYNTHYNSVYANMVANEMFLDTAIKRASVLSHAKGLGYRPQGWFGARAYVDVEVNDIIGDNIGTSLRMRRGTKFNTSINNKQMTFVTANDYYATISNDECTFSNVELIEGEFFTFSWNMIPSEDDPGVIDHTLKYLIPNAKVDVSSIVMRVYDTGNSFNSNIYHHSSTLMNIQEDNQVFFTQEAENDKTEIFFGNGTTTGAIPTPGQVVTVEYMTTNGKIGNGARVFVLAEQIIDNGMQVVPNGTSTTLVIDDSNPTGRASSGGKDPEDIETIRYNASMNYPVQNRAVTAFDYKRLIMDNFYNIKSIRVWGGEENVPIQYNSVFICIEPTTQNFLTEIEKQQIRTLLKEKSVMNMRVIFVEPEYLNVKVTSNVYFTPSSIAKNINLEELIRTAISNYSDNTLSEFGNPLMISKFEAMIDSVHNSIIGNDTNLVVYKDMKVEVNKSRLYTIVFNNQIQQKDGSIFSDKFDMGYGVDIILKNVGNNMIIGHTLTDGTFAELKNVGTVDYVNGIVSIQSLNVTAFSGDQVNLYMIPLGKNLFSAQSNILKINDEDTKINLIQSTIAQ